MGKSSRHCTASTTLKAGAATYCRCRWMYVMRTCGVRVCDCVHTVCVRSAGLQCRQPNRMRPNLLRRTDTIALVFTHNTHTSMQTKQHCNTHAPAARKQPSRVRSKGPPSARGRKRQPAALPASCWKCKKRTSKHFDGCNRHLLCMCVQQIQALQQGITQTNNIARGKLANNHTCSRNGIIKPRAARLSATVAVPLLVSSS